MCIRDSAWTDKLRDTSTAKVTAKLNECKKATAPEISRKIARCRGHMTTIRNKMDGNVRTLKTHPANDAAATELKAALR